MVNGPDFVRDIRPDDFAEVDALLQAAFGGVQEVALVHALRRDKDMVSESVIHWDGRIIAYAGLSRMVAPVGWLCLAPVAVLPEAQRGALTPAGQAKGHWQVGKRLVSELASAARTPEFDKSPAIVVLGQPEFYEQCGFSRTRAARLTSPYPRDFTMLAAPGEDVPKAELIYPAAFSSDD